MLELVIKSDNLIGHFIKLGGKWYFEVLCFLSKSFVLPDILLHVFV